MLQKKQEKYIKKLETCLEKMEETLDFENQKHQEEMDEIKKFVGKLYVDLSKIQQFVSYVNLPEFTKFYDRYKDKTWDMMEKWKKKN